jgi:PadR family transcriptional regulator, regulatory protein PadR
MSKEEGSRSQLLQGTLDLIVLRTLDTMGPQHGYGLAQRIQQVSKDLLHLNQGTLYPALLRLEQQGWIKSEWGKSENNRQARFYSISRAGKKALQDETERWRRLSDMINSLLEDPVS